MISIFAALLLAGAAEPSQAPEAAAAAPAPAAQAAPPAKKEPQRICWDETPVGTRFSHRVCATKQEIEDRRRHDQDAVMRRQATGTIGGN